MPRAASTLPIYAGFARCRPASPRVPLRSTASRGTRAFWVFNWVANSTYSRYRDMIQDVRQTQEELEGGFFARQASVDAAALKLYAQSPELARSFLTDYC